MNCKGMTLIEVMVALMILSVASVAIVKTSTLQIRHLTTIEQKEFASLIANNVLAQLTIEGIWPDAHWTRGTSTMAGKDWYWQWRGIPTADRSTRTLEIEVRSAEDERAPLIHLRTLRVKNGE